MTLDTEPTGSDAAPSATDQTDAPAAPSAATPVEAPAAPARRRRAASRPAGPPPADAAAEPAAAPAASDAAASVTDESAAAPAAEVPARPVRKRASRKKAVAAEPAPVVEPAPVAEPAPEPALADGPAPGEPTPDPALAEPVAEATAEPPVRRRRARKTAAAPVAAPEPTPEAEQPVEAPVAQAPIVEAPTEEAPVVEPAAVEEEDAADLPQAAAPVFAMPLFQAPDPTAAVPSRRRRAASRPAGPPAPVADEPVAEEPAAEDETTSAAAATTAGPARGARVRARARGAVGGPTDDLPDDLPDDLVDDPDETGDETADDTGDEVGDEVGEAARRRRRRRGGRGRRGRLRDDEPESGADDAAGDDEDAAGEPEGDDTPEAAETTGSRRRRRRRRGSSGSDVEPSPDDPPNTVVKVRDSRRGGGGGDDVTGLRGSTRLEAKKQRRREGREAGRRRPVITEAEFLARRESVDRVMVVREREGRTQIGVLEDGVLVEHYVARRTQTSMVGNVYLGRVQNVLPSMEAAFVDIGKGRNAVLYAGEVNWDAAGLEGQPKRIEHALKSGESVLVQVTKDPIGHKGARLTSQVSLPGRYLVYVPDGSMTGISRKLPDIERARLKKVLRDVVPEHAGVIVRTAAEGASEAELERDVTRLQAQWEDISRKAGAVNSPALLYGEPDLAIRVVRDIFNEDFAKLIISGDEAWDTLQGYIGHVAPDLVDRLERWTGDGDVFAGHRIDEQLAKALERKVWLPSGGSLVIDRTEAMTVIDVNTGKFTGAGGNLEETVTKNNVEAAEEIVRQLRLRDLGGIIVVDFIDMVLESNRDLVLRRLLECLGRDRTKHQVAEVTSLGLVQMTRKRVGSGLLEVFSENCEHCGGRGVIVHDEPVEKRQQDGGGGAGSGRGRSGPSGSAPSGSGPSAVTPVATSGGTSNGSPAGDEPAADEPAPASGGGRRRGRRGRGGESAAPTLAAGH